MKIKFNYKILNKFALVIIPFLFLFWLSISILLLSRVSFSVLTYQTENLKNASDRKIKLYKNEAYQGEFIAKDNNLGIIILSVDNYKKAKSGDEEILVFRFREKGKKNWDYKMEYSSNLFDSQSSFPFGIPLAVDSKNKHYEFELSSLRGESNNPLRFKSSMTFITGYQYSKSEILKGGSTTLRFVLNKFIGFITDPELLFKSLIYLVPLIFYLIIYLFFKKFPVKIKEIAIPFKIKYIKIFILFVLLKIILPKDTNLDGFFIALFVWIFLVSNFKLKSKVSFFFSLFLIIFWVMIIPFGFQGTQKIVNELVYAFFAFGCLQLLYEQVKSIKKYDEKKKIKQRI